VRFDDVDLSPDLGGVMTPNSIRLLLLREWILYWENFEKANIEAMDKFCQEVFPASNQPTEFKNSISFTRRMLRRAKMELKILEEMSVAASRVPFL
jgi:hypothetical protein